jgi:endonuclease YncB( thermonuclease family)
LFLAAAAISFAAAAHTIEGRVVRVSDGDTVTVLDGLHAQHRIRLAGIDAPEKAQPYGDASTRHLSEMVFGASVTVEYEKHDRYGRIVGKIMKDGHDASLEQLRVGLAWHYKQYQREQTRADRGAYADVEHEAQQAHVGLWHDPAPVAPWTWRLEQRAKHRIKPEAQTRAVQSAYQ